MLGDLVLECEGKITGSKVLRNGKWELIGEFQGLFLGEEFTMLQTAEIDISPDGRIGNAESWGFFNTKGGTRGQFVGHGRPVRNPDGTSSARGAYFFSNPPGKYDGLNEIPVIFENDSDKEGNMRMKGWEWK
jgi:hypothetical protein